MPNHASRARTVPCTSALAYQRLLDPSDPNAKDRYHRSFAPVVARRNPEPPAQVPSSGSASATLPRSFRRYKTRLQAFLLAALLVGSLSLSNILFLFYSSGIVFASPCAAAARSAEDCVATASPPPLLLDISTRRLCSNLVNQCEDCCLVLAQSFDHSQGSGRTYNRGGLTSTTPRDLLQKGVICDRVMCLCCKV